MTHNTKNIEIKESPELINSKLHPVRKEYLERLDEIKKEGTILGSEFEKKFGIKL
ncbi:hypothetical protein [Methanosarcina lacustris]|uniref:hypothetical protein n=1 Tax=Methanosarcina lacustris TaxID=170861 RepID=UPI000AF0B23F|nr:hypothetical protein [Methanosarcina lacustris]